MRMKTTILKAMQDAREYGWTVMNTARVSKDPSCSHLLKVMVWTGKDYFFGGYNSYTSQFTDWTHFPNLKEANKFYYKEVM